MWRLSIKRLLLIFLFITSVFATDKLPIPEGKIESSYEACKNQIIVSKEKYEKSKSAWDIYETKCHSKIQTINEAGITALDPLKEGIKYLDLSQRVARKIISNLEKSRLYANCSQKCFNGAINCPSELSENNKTILCSERKNEILNGLKINSRKIRIELALSNDAPGLINANINNILSLDKSKLINTNLRDFELGTPNPIGRTELTEREVSQAKRRLEFDREKLETEFKEKKYKHYNDWMSVKLMEKFDEHRENYRRLIYEDAPIFSVIESPEKFVDGSEPQWNDSQIAKAFKKISDNSIVTEEKINYSLKKSKVEFSRLNGEALKHWLVSLAPGTKDQNELLYYMGMKNQVEEVLKEDPKFCGVATEMEVRLHSKEMQNMALTFAASFAGSGVVKGASSIFRIGRALTGAEAAGLTGMSMGAVNLGDGFRKYNSASVEAASKSGLAEKQEGKSLRSLENLTNSRDNIKMSAVFLPLDIAGSWSVGRSLYNTLANQMAKDLPSISALVKRAKVDNVARDQLVDQWLIEKVKNAFDNGILSEVEKSALEAAESRSVLETLTTEIEKSNPQFFKNPKNIDFLLKTAATTAKKLEGDPKDLGDKAKQLLIHFNTEAMNGNWDPKAQQGLLKIFDYAIEELRLSAKKDPATYAKFNVDKEAQKKILLNAFQKTGLSKENDTQVLLQCALPN